MLSAALKDCSYCLQFVPELAFHYGNTPCTQRRANPDSGYLKALAGSAQSFEQVCGYPPNLTYIGAMTPDELAGIEPPWHSKPVSAPLRLGPFGEIMPEDEFLGLMDICDVFDLIWLTQDFAASIRPKLQAHPLLASRTDRLEHGRPVEEIMAEISRNGALPLYFEGGLAGCCRRAHEQDPNLSAHVMLENLAGKAGSVLGLLHLLDRTGLAPEAVDFVVECSEEAVGDANPRGGGNMAKSLPRRPDA